MSDVQDSFIIFAQESRDMYPFLHTDKRIERVRMSGKKRRKRYDMK